ncbi:hypothetical protein [Streptomyces sp. NPDC088725]|uniref:hypothetical protein n=1 Tax=Streptomyces sp. NPDC088725 TaxID=3365873 RepID=UPI00381F30F1
MERDERPISKWQVQSARDGASESLTGLKAAPLEQRENPMLFHGASTLDYLDLEDEPQTAVASTSQESQSTGRVPAPASAPEPADGTRRA